MSQSVKKIAVIGTVGVPANYGGFETLVENIIGGNASDNVHYTVYCSSKAYPQKMKSYKGATLKYVPLKANGMQSIAYDLISIVRAICSSVDVILVLGVSGAAILPLVRLFSRKRIIVNIDGLEHKRDKWSDRVRKLLKWLEKIAVRNCDVVIADNQAIAEYVKTEYGKDAQTIAYGGDHVICQTIQIKTEVLNKYNLTPNKYSFSLCRIEPENNVHLTLEAFAAEQSEKLVFVGNWGNSNYGIKLLEQYSQYDNIELLSPIYDIATLNVLRGNCKNYIHGHSAGGTNPSLVEAMFFGMTIFAFDVAYNRFTTENCANYFATAAQLQQMLHLDTHNGPKMEEVAARRYRWQTIARSYEYLY